MPAAQTFVNVAQLTSREALWNWGFPSHHTLPLQRYYFAVASTCSCRHGVKSPLTHSLKVVTITSAWRVQLLLGSSEFMETVSMWKAWSFKHSKTTSNVQFITNEQVKLISFISEGPISRFYYLLYFRRGPGGGGGGGGKKVGNPCTILYLLNSNCICAHHAFVCPSVCRTLAWPPSRVCKHCACFYAITRGRVDRRVKLEKYNHVGHQQTDEL